MKEYLKEKYHEMYHKHLVDGKDSKIMAVWGSHEKKLIHELLEKHPEIAEKYIYGLEACINAIGWNNYLSRKEAETILSGMSPKAKWTIEEVECACKTLGVPCEDKPYFNLCALAVTMNMEVSDHEKTIGKHFANDTQAIHFVYEWAIEDLMDKDHPEYIRPYFNL